MAGLVEVKLNQEQINRINKILYTTPQKAKTVFSSSIRTGMKAGRTQAEREIKERYDITNANMRTYKNVKMRGPLTQGDEVVGELEFSGKKIPLYRFHPNPKVRMYTDRYVNGKAGWKITSPVSAADVKGQMTPRPEGFIATFKSGHTGIFKRDGGKSASGKETISEYWGFSIEEMLDYAPARENITNKMSETVEKRMEHELYRVLNGFG